jgi:hypothetical protein
MWNSRSWAFVLGNDILIYAMAPQRADLGWLRSAAWDVFLLAFGWVPFYLWLLATPLGRPGAAAEVSGSFGTALLIALALNFLHRHYVLVLVYGDRSVLDARPRAYALAPPVALAIVGGLLMCGPTGKITLLGALGTWNVWHVLQQRYGLLRAYAARARGGLEKRDMSRRDWRLLWSAFLVTAPLVVLRQRSAFEARPEAARIFSVIGPWLGPAVLAAAGVLFALLFALAAVAWVRGEVAARPLARLPRYLFLGSTFALLGIFLVHGPVIGYLVFGIAHSIEYIAFVHHFGERKYAGQGGALAARLFADVRRAPLVLAPLFGIYLLVHEHRFSLAFVAYFSTTSALHYLYDGWIWRLREPRVSEPLVLTNPNRAS